jgi:hypothetical protein
MTLVRHAWFAKCFAINQVDLEDARMKLWDFCQIHAERPHRFQWRVDDDLLPGPKRWSQFCLRIAGMGFAGSRERDYIADHKYPQHNFHAPNPAGGYGQKSR